MLEAQDVGEELRRRADVVRARSEGGEGRGGRRQPL